MSHTPQQHPTFDNKPSHKLAFVLGGGGARGALQVGALRVLQEAGIQPDMLVGTSIGAVNAAMLAIYGYSPAGLDTIERAWLDAKESNTLTGDYLKLMVRAMINRMGKETYHEQTRAYYIRNGISPDLRFGDFTTPALYCVATDLNRYQPFIFGEDPEQRVLDGVLASSAIPPWIAPIKIGKNMLMDGGALSNLPIEPAMRMGATEIIALDLFDPRPPDLEARGFSPFFDKLLTSLEHRQVDMELALAQARGVPVHHWRLRYRVVVPVWDFSHTEDLFHTGNQQGKAYLDKMREKQVQAQRQKGFWGKVRAWWRKQKK